MKARGYDPSTVAEAEAVREVCRAIEAAFAGVTLGNGIGLQEGQGHDDYEDAAACAAYRAKDEKDDWHRISAEALNRCHSSLSFFDAEGMRAIMEWCAWGDWLLYFLNGVVRQSEDALSRAERIKQRAR